MKLGVAYAALCVVLLAILHHVVLSDTCPSGCECVNTTTSLTVDCHNRPGVDPEQLSWQLDSLLAGNLTHSRLSIVNSPLRHVPRSVCRLTTLTSLHIYRNQLVALPDNCFNRLTNLRRIRLDRNNISTLQNGLFSGLRQLKILHLQNNSIASIGLRVFDNTTAINYLDLSNNSLDSVEPWPYYISANGDRTLQAKINLQHNRISTFTNAMGLRFSCRMRRVHAELDLRFNRIGHFSDVLQGWRITQLQLLCIAPFVDGRSTLRLRLDHNEFACDCVDFRFYQLDVIFPYFRLFEGARCSAPEGLRNRAIASVPLDYFICEIEENCPTGCRCVYRPKNETVHVDCSGKELSRLPAVLPALPKRRSTYKLIFSNNRHLQTLESYDYFVNSAVLDLSNSGVETVLSWPELLTIREVYLDGNRLTALPRSVASLNVFTAVLRLGNNQWKCSCDARWMANWLNSLGDQLADRGSILCDSPPRLRGKNILQIDEDGFCIDPVRRALATSLSSMLAVVLAAVSALAVVYRLRVRLYARWRFHPFHRDECRGERMEFDVFLSCSSLDHDSHGQRIKDTLTRRAYRVCYHYSDFQPGPIAENIMESVTTSRRTICVLTDNFLQSHYCMYEFEVALNHSIAVKRSRRLIVLMAMSRDSLKNLNVDEAGSSSGTVSLRQYVRQYTYIDYSKDDWMDKLLYALPLRGLDHVDDGQIEDETMLLA